MELQVSALNLRTYLNRALIFISKAKLGIQPIFGCVHLSGDKMHVYNGETGAIISVPFSVDTPIFFYPFELAKVVNNTPDDEMVDITIDAVKMEMRVKTSAIKIKIRLVEGSEFPKIVIPELEAFEVEGIYQKLRNAAFSTSEDASLPHFQAIQVSKGAVCSTDHRGVWREKTESPHGFLVSALLMEHFSKMGAEPSKLALTETQIFVYYPDMLMFGIRLSDEEKFPQVSKVLDEVCAQPTVAVVKFDREGFVKKFTLLRELPGKEDAVRIKCVGGVLSAENVLTDSNSVEGVITLNVDSTADFENVIVNGSLFANAIERFNTMSILADGKRLLFQSDTQVFGITRRAA